MNLKGSVAIKAMNGHTCVKKYSTEEPIEEVTVGIGKRFPGLAFFGPFLPYGHF